MDDMPLADDVLGPHPDDLPSADDVLGPPSPEEAFPDAIKFAEHTKAGVTSSAQARTPMQVRPPTAAKPGYGVTPAQDDSDEEYERVGRDYSRALLKHYGSPALAGMAYNAGPDNLNGWLKSIGDPRDGAISEDDFINRVPWPTTRKYARDVLSKMPAPPELPSAEDVLGPDPNDMTGASVPAAPPNQDPFETRLTPDEETRFQAWKQKYAPNDGGADYDLRGAYKMGFEPDPETGHWPDTFKKPNHPTFSDESLYAQPPYAAAAKAGQWFGSVYVPAGADPQTTIQKEPDLDKRMDATLAYMSSRSGVGVIPAIQKGIARSWLESGQIAEKRPQVIKEGPEGDPLFQGPAYEIPTKLAYQFGKNFPELAGGVVGGAIGGEAGPTGTVVGAAAGASLEVALQKVGPHFAEELQKTPNDPNGAYERAWQATGEDAAASGVSWLAFGVAPFKGPIKNILFQGLGMQPAVAASTQEVRNIAAGAPVGVFPGKEEMAGTTQAALESTAQTPIMLASHGIASAISRARGAPQGAGAEAGQEPPPGEAPPTPPGGGGLGGPGGGSPKREFGEGEIVTVKPFTSGLEPYDVTVLSTSKDGKYTTIQFDDGRKREVPTGFLTDNAITTTPPEAAKPVSDEPLIDNQPPEDLIEEPREPGEDRVAKEDLEAAMGAVPERSPTVGMPERKPEADQAVRNRVLADANLFGDGASAEAVKAKGFNSLQRDAQHVVLAQVRGALNDDEVLRSVVETVPVDVMNVLVGRQVAPEDLLHDKSVLTNVLSVPRDVPIPKPVSAFVDSLATAVKSGAAKAATKETGLGARSSVVQLPDKGGATVETRGRDIRQSVSAGQPIAVDVNPTAAQKEAGNYLKGAVNNFHGMDIAIETPKGETRSGTAPDGTEWHNVNTLADYGYIKGTEGADGEPLDVYIGHNLKSETAYVVDQVNQNGSFDEHKGVVAVDSPQEAAAVYDEGFSDGKGPERRRSITEMPVAEFNEWAHSRGAKKGAELQPIGRNVTSEVSDVAAPTTRPLDDNKKPIFHEGERVVINDDGPMKGRHGTISKAVGMTMAPIFGSGNRTTSYHYQVKTDQGYETFASDMGEETEKPTKVAADPVIDGHPMPPHQVRAGIDYAKRNALKHEAAAGRARKGESRDSWLRAAKAERDKAARYHAALDAWTKKNPDAAKTQFPAGSEVPVDVKPTVKPIPPSVKATYSENEAKDGVELRFKDRPDDATLGRLKGAGFRWSKYQKLWYARRTPKTIDLAQEMAGKKPVPAGEPVTPQAPPAGLQIRTQRGFGPNKDRFEAVVTTGPHAGVRSWGHTVDQAEAEVRRLVAQREPAILATPTPAQYPSPANVAVVSGAATAQEVAAIEAAVPTQPAPKATRRVAALPPGVKPEWTPIGKNSFGDTLYADQRGVRSYVKDNVRITEPVGMRPTRAGMEFTVEREPNDPRWDYVTPTAEVEKQADEEGARAELDQSLYQPGDMPVTSADPTPQKQSGYARGDDVVVNPENRDIAPAREPVRAVVDVSEDGTDITLDGGQHVSPDEIKPLPPIGVPPKLPAEAPPNGLQEPLRPGTAQPGPQAVYGAAAVGQAGRIPPTEVGGGAPAPGPTPGVGAQGAIGLTQRPAGGAAGRGAGVRADVGIPPPGERPAPRASGRPPDANVQGADYRIEPGEIGEDRGPMQKARDNLAAIEIVKRLKEDGRPATRAEQTALAKYVGWGGLAGAFKNNQGKYGSGFEEIGKRLEALLTPAEHATASKSTQYAHYTAEHIIRSMWDAVARMGFKGGTVFEPGMGVGHFLGMMPGDIAAASAYQGIEMDHLTADIAKLLYPQSGVRQADFTQTVIPENSFDLVIGNPPFSDTVIKADPKYATRNFMLHDYFFAKAMDSLRPGGVLAFVTSAGTMNKGDHRARAYLGERAQFLGGVRLPSTAFKQNAGTEVTTDILFFQKRPERLEPKEFDTLFGKEDPAATWAGTVQRTLPNAQGATTKGAVSRYFSEHPEQVLGQEGFFDKLYKGRYAVREAPGTNLPIALSKALDALPKDIYTPQASPDSPEQTERDFTAPETKDGSFYLKDGKLWQYENGAGRAVPARAEGGKGSITAANRERVHLLIPIRDAYRDTIRADLAEDEAGGVLARAALNTAYDKFFAKFGPINKAEFQYRRPTIVQQEVARAEEREAARMRGEPWREGDFDAQPHLEGFAVEDLAPEEEGEAKKPKGPSWSKIARMRHEARLKAQAEGRKFDEGSFDPADMPDNALDKRPNIEPFMDDPESYRLRAIEHYDDQTGASKKKDVFYKSILTKEMEPDIRSAQDGVLWSLNKFGRLDLNAIAERRGQTRDALIAELGDSAFVVPGTDSTYQMADEYLSGDILDKLETAKRYAESDATLQRNVAALEAAKPAPLAPSEITMTLGMPWIPAAVISDFAKNHLGIANDVYVRHSGVLGGWTVTVGDHGANWERWSTADFPAAKLLAEALNHTRPRVFKTEYVDGERKQVFDPVGTQSVSDRIDEISREFADYDPVDNSLLGWIKADEGRLNGLADLYNNTANRVRLRQIDGSYLTTPGVASDWKWRPHQRRVVARVILTGNTYIAHAVGAGKTSEYIGAGMEMRRLGLVKKPMYVVPNNMLGQFTKEFYEQYPTAKIAVADERRFHTDRRKQFIANVAQDDLDAVILTHSSFGKIPISPEFQKTLIDEEIASLEEALKDLDKVTDRITRKKLENKKEDLEQRMQGAFAGRKDLAYTFEELGIDFLFVDEAHLFRKLDFATRQNLKGIDGDGSDRSFDLYSKVRYLNSKSPGRSVVMGSGTPVTNTIGELYSLSRYMQPDTLAKRGLSHFDSWAASYGTTKTETEPTPQGTYERVSRFRKFVNAHDLFKMVAEVMDVVTPKQLEEYVVRPKLKGGKRQLVLAPKTEAYEDFQANLVRRVEALKRRKGPPKKGDDIILSVINDGRGAAVDLRLVQLGESDPNSKLNMMLDNVISQYRDGQNTKFYDPGTNYQKQIAAGPSTQIIFSNFGVHPMGPMRFSAYTWIKQRLLQAGIPKNEIAFIGDYKSHVAKQKLFNDMNAGKVRILIGHTQKLGVGLNVQRRLAVAHNLDPLWYPADDEQRVGRPLRQGNWNPEVSIYDYATKGTYDEQMWKMMGSKARAIEQFFRGDPTMRTIDDFGEASAYEQASAMAAADDRVIKLTELKHDLEKLQRQASGHDREQHALRAKLDYAKGEVVQANKAFPVLAADIAQRVPTRGDAFKAAIGKREYTKRAEAADALGKEITTELPKLTRGERVVVAQLGGFTFLMEPYGKSQFSLYMRRSDRSLDMIPTLAATPTGILRGMEDRVAGLEDRVAYWENVKAEAQQKIASITPQLGKPFGKYDEIKALRGQVATLERQLQPQKAINSIEEADKAIKENADDYNARRIDHAEFTDKANMLQARRRQLVEPKPPGEEPQFQVARVPPQAPPFFSALTKAVEGMKQERAPAAQWQGVIKNAPGVKQDEIDWSGVKEWLADQKGPITKQALVDYLKAHEVQIKEVHRGGTEEEPHFEAPQMRARYAELDRVAHAGGLDAMSPMDRQLMHWMDAHPEASDTEFLIREYDLWRAANQMPQMSADDLHSELLGLRERGKRHGPETDQQIQWLSDFGRRWEAAQAPQGWQVAEAGGPGTYESYTLPGGRNYREILMTLPDASKALEPEVRALGITKPFVDISPSDIRAAGGSRDLQNRWMDAIGAQTFRSGHFPEPNIITHMRVDDRTDADGKKVLFVEEVQSDWHQKGRRYGYTPDPAARDALLAPVNALRNEVNALLERQGRLGFDTMAEARNALAEDPKSWDLPTDADRALAQRWSEARTALARYDRAKTHGVPDAPFKTTWPELAMKRLLRMAAEEGYDRLAWTTGEQQAERYDLSRHIDTLRVQKDQHGNYLLSVKRGSRPWEHLATDVPEAKLADHLGKDLASKIADEKLGHGGEKTYTGLDLKIGGEGMKAFYDKMLPAFMNKYTKKWGAKVEDGYLPGEPQAIARGTGKDVYPVHKIDITPAMIDSVMAGQPMFERGAAGALQGPTMELARGLEGTLMIEPVPAEEAVIDAVNEVMGKLAPSALVAVTKAMRGKGQPVYGASYKVGLQRVIAWALESPDAVGTVRHEAVHFLKNEGFLSEDEWKTLEKAAKDGDWSKKHDINTRYPDLTPARKLEEAIAEEFSEWRRNPSAEKSSFLNRIFERIAQFLHRLAMALRRMFDRDATAADIFAKMESGEVGARGTAPGDPSEPTFQRPKKPPTTVDAAVKDLDDQIAAIGHNAPPGDIGKQAAESAKGFGPPPKGRPTKFLSGLKGGVERYYIFPRTLAATDWRSAKYWDAEQLVDDEDKRLLHAAAEGSKKYAALTPIQRKSLHAVEELNRLKNQVLPDDGMPIVARSDIGITKDDFLSLQSRQMAGRLYDAGIPLEDAERIVKRILDEQDPVTLRRAMDQMNPPLAHSKYGDVIELDPQTTEAYHERRALFQQRWRDLMRGAARKAGWQGAPDAKTVRAAAELEERQAAKGHLNRLADLLDAMAAQERTGYVPFMRFDDYYLYVTAKPGEDRESLDGFPRTLEFRLVDSSPPLGGIFAGTTRRAGEVPKSAQDAIAELRRRYPESQYDIGHGYLNAKPDLLRTLDIPAIEKLLTMLGQKDSELFTPMVEEIQKKMYEELTAGFKRRATNVPGYDPDFARASGSYLHWTARHVALQVHGENLRRAQEQYIDTHPDKGGTRAYWRRYALDNEPGAMMRSRSRSLQQFGFYMEMAGNPASSMKILLHGPEMAAFTLGIGLGATKAGTVTAAGHLLPAMGNALSGLRADATEGMRLRIADMKGITDEERRGLEHADNIGLFHSALADELGRMRAGGYDETSEAGRTIARVAKVLGSNISVMDRANRIGTWLAAYRMAKKPGVLKAWNKVWFDNQIYREMITREGATPTSMARFMVDEGVGVWGTKNQPEMQRRLPLMFQFQGFRMRWLSTLIRNMHRMGNEGRMAGLFMLIPILALAGVLGLPFVGDLEKAVEGLYKFLTGHDPMLESRLYDLMEHSYFGKRGAEAILKGPARMLGIDLTGLGFGNIATSVDLQYNPWGLLGATPGIIVNSAQQTIDRLRSGQTYGAVAPLLPNMLRNPYQALVTYPREGVRTAQESRFAPPVVRPEQLGTGDKMARALGFQPSEIARAYENRLFFERLAAAARQEAPKRPTPFVPPERRVPQRGRRPSPYPQ